MSEGGALPGFLLASLVLAATPGPGVIYIVARTLAQGRRAGLSSVVGVAMGNLVNAIGASVGLAVLLAIFPPAFSVVRYAGAAYLVYLGINTLASGSVAENAAFGTTDLGRIFRDGFLVALLNPKTALFFAAFLPQFIDTKTSAVFQSLLLGTLFVLIAILTDSLYVFTASAASQLLHRWQGAHRFARRLSAGVLIGLGILTAVSGSREPDQDRHREKSGNINGPGPVSAMLQAL